MNDKSWPMIRRAWIERFAARVGEIRRSDISAALGIGPAQVSDDIQELLRLHPGCLTYDLSAKVYRWTGSAASLPVPSLLSEFVPPDREGDLHSLRGELSIAEGERDDYKAELEAIGAATGCGHIDGLANCVRDLLEKR